MSKKGNARVVTQKASLRISYNRNIRCGGGETLPNRSHFVP